jgi:hypothetical protein
MVAVKAALPPATGDRRPATAAIGQPNESSAGAGAGSEP